MSERFLLPASMGGHECELVWCKGTNEYGVEVSKVRYDLDGLVETVLPSSWLTPVKPPLEEPSLGVHFSYGLLCWKHTQRGWERCGAKVLNGGEIVTWRWLVDGYLNRWPDACKILVEDPLAGDPIQLPWRGRTKVLDLPVVVDANDGAIELMIGTRDWVMPPEFARAVWAAATQTERSEP